MEERRCPATEPGRLRAKDRKAEDMSLHYDFALACDLKPDIPKQVSATLTYITRVDEYDPGDLPHSDVFHDRYWRYLFRVETTDFPGVVRRVFQKAFRYSYQGRDVFRDTLDVRTYIVDDAIGKYIAFAEWLAPYSESEGFVGYFRSDISDDPVLIYFGGGSVDFVDAVGFSEGKRRN